MGFRLWAFRPIRACAWRCRTGARLPPGSRRYRRTQFMSQRKGRLDGRCEPIAAAGSSLSQLRIRPGLRKYIAVRSIVPATLSYAVLRHFHAAAAMTMVATSSLRQELSARGFRKLGTWTRGVDTDLFTPDDAAALDLPRPIFMTVGRVAVEKNLEAFLSLDPPVQMFGGGPQKAGGGGPGFQKPIFKKKKKVFTPLFRGRGFPFFPRPFLPPFFFFCLIIKNRAVF